MPRLGNLSSLVRWVRLYRRGLGAHLRAALEYEKDFVLLVVAAVLTQAAGIVFLGALFTRIPRLNGWRFPDVVLIFSMVVVGEGAGSLLCEGTWRLAQKVNKGEIDYMLLRPYPVVLQVMSSDIGFNGIGNLLSGGLMLGWALGRVDVAWSPARVGGAVALLASAILIKAAINLATNASAFWLNSPFSTFAYAMHQVGELGKYPIGIYPFVLKITLTCLVPFAFVSFFPASALLGRGSFAWVGWLTPLVALACVGAALGIFRRGLLRYESAGN